MIAIGLGLTALLLTVAAVALAVPAPWVVAGRIRYANDRSTCADRREGRNPR